MPAVFLSDTCGLGVATVNVRSLGTALVNKLINELTAAQPDIGIIAVQEARIPADQMASIQGAVKRHGWTLWPGKQAYDRLGRPLNGNVILARWPTRQVTTPTSRSDPLQCPPAHRN